MLVNDIIREINQEQQIIKEKCSDFLMESGGLPLYKELPETYSDIHKVKIRIKKKADSFTNTFNNAFEHVEKLRQRALFASGIPSKNISEGKELFYVFPVQKYKFVYNPAVENSRNNYVKSFKTIAENSTDQQIITELIKYMYSSENLMEGIKNNAEIIIYNIPCYYAARCSVFNYEDIIL